METQEAIERLKEIRRTMRQEITALQNKLAGVDEAIDILQAPSNRPERHK